MKAQFSMAYCSHLTQTSSGADILQIFYLAEHCNLNRSFLLFSWDAEYLQIQWQLISISHHFTQYSSVSILRKLAYSIIVFVCLKAEISLPTFYPKTKKCLLVCILKIGKCVVCTRCTTICRFFPPLSPSVFLLLSYLHVKFEQIYQKILD